MYNKQHFLSLMSVYLRCFSLLTTAHPHESLQETFVSLGTCHRTELRCLKGMRICIVVVTEHVVLLELFSKSLKSLPPTLNCSLLTAHSLSQAKS